MTSFPEMEISNLEIFFQTSTPPPDRIRQCGPPPENVSFDLDPLLPPLPGNFSGKMWIYLSVTSIG